MKVKNQELLKQLKSGNEKYLSAAYNTGDISKEIRRRTAEAGQEPYAIVIACSDSRVIPESIFSAGIGDLFVIRVAGNVLDRHQLGSIEYAASHLHTKMIILLGHTGCGAVGATLHGGGDGNVKYITDKIKKAIGDETDDYRASVKNVEHGLEIIRREFAEHPDIPTKDLDIVGAIYHIESGEVEWL